MAGERHAIRPATLDDVAAMRAVMAANGEDGPIAVGRSDANGPYLRHLVRHHRALVTEEAGALVAFGIVVDTGVSIQLADLYVLPEYAGRGHGRALLGALFGDAPRRTTFSSADPRALPIYVRAGMMPLWPILFVEGPAELLPEPPHELRVRDATAAESAALELAWTGVDRAADHALWANETASPDPFVVDDRSGPVATGYGRARQVSDARALGRMLVRPAADPVGPVVAGLARVARGGTVITGLPGPNPALRTLLELGFRIVDRAQFMASHDDLVDPVRLLPNPGML
jgi:GNAT superfamily N-acetyltransferase